MCISDIEGERIDSSIYLSQHDVCPFIYSSYTKVYTEEAATSVLIYWEGSEGF